MPPKNENTAALEVTKTESWSLNDRETKMLLAIVRNVDLMSNVDWDTLSDEYGFKYKKNARQSGKKFLDKLLAYGGTHMTLNLNTVTSIAASEPASQPEETGETTVSARELRNIKRKSRANSPNPMAGVEVEELGAGKLPVNKRRKQNSPRASIKAESDHGNDHPPQPAPTRSRKSKKAPVKDEDDNGDGGEKEEQKLEVRIPVPAGKSIFKTGLKSSVKTAAKASPKSTLESTPETATPNPKKDDLTSLLSMVQQVAATQFTPPQSQSQIYQPALQSPFSTPLTSNPNTLSSSPLIPHNPEPYHTANTAVLEMEVLGQRVPVTQNDIDTAQFHRLPILQYMAWRVVNGLTSGIAVGIAAHIEGEGEVGGEVVQKDATDDFMEVEA